MTMHKNDPKTVLAVSKRISRLAKELIVEARHVANVPNDPKFGLSHDDMLHGLYAEASRKAYAAILLQGIAKKLEVEATLKLKPDLKCRFCRGKASICYPRHLEGKSCA